MSQPRRRRRRRRKSGAPSDQSQTPEQKQKQQPAQQQNAGAPARRRRRRGRARGESKRPASPKSSEDLVRALPKDPPATLTAPADGQKLEGIIGELQSQYGVPQYPQEYRITIKVADERDHRPEPAAQENRKQETEPSKGGGPRREKAPAAPLLMRDGSTPSPNKRRRRGRRGRRRGGGGSEGGSAGAGGSGGNGSPEAPSS